MRNYAAVSKKLGLITFQYQIIESFFPFIKKALDFLVKQAFLINAQLKIVVAKKNIWEIGYITKITDTDRVRERASENTDSHKR
jgi:hypothetical protein